MLASPASKRSVVNALENMNSLIANLEVKESNISQAEVQKLHDNINQLMWKVSDSQIGASEELEELLYSFKSGIMTPFQLESFIVAEQQKSEFILNLSAMIGEHLAALCDQFQEMALYANDGNNSVMSEQYEDIGAKLRLMVNEVQSMTKIINSPNSELHSAMGSVEISIAGYQETMKKLNKRIYSSLDAKYNASRDDGSVNSESVEKVDGDSSRNRRTRKRSADANDNNNNGLVLINPTSNGAPGSGMERLVSNGRQRMTPFTPTNPNAPLGSGGFSSFYNNNNNGRSPRDCVMVDASVQTMETTTAATPSTSAAEKKGGKSTHKKVVHKKQHKDGSGGSGNVSDKDSVTSGTNSNKGGLSNLSSVPSQDLRAKAVHVLEAADSTRMMLLSSRSEDEEGGGGGVVVSASVEIENKENVSSEELARAKELIELQNKKIDELETLLRKAMMRRDDSGQDLKISKESMAGMSHMLNSLSHNNNNGNMVDFTDSLSTIGNSSNHYNNTMARTSPAGQLGGMMDDNATLASEGSIPIDQKTRNAVKSSSPPFVHSEAVHQAECKVDGGGFKSLQALHHNNPHYVANSTIDTSFNHGGILLRTQENKAIVASLLMENDSGGDGAGGGGGGAFTSQNAGYIARHEYHPPLHSSHQSGKSAGRPCSSRPASGQVRSRILSAGGNNSGGQPATIMRHLSAKRFEGLTPRGVMSSVFAPESNTLTALRNKDSKWQTAMSVLQSQSQSQLTLQQATEQTDKQCGTEDLLLYRREGIKSIHFERIVTSNHVSSGQIQQQGGGGYYDDDLLEMSVSNDSQNVSARGPGGGGLGNSYYGGSSSSLLQAGGAGMLSSSIGGGVGGGLNATTTIPAPSYLLTSQNSFSTNVTNLELPPLQPQQQQHYQAQQQAAATAAAAVTTSTSSQPATGATGGEVAPKQRRVQSASSTVAVQRRPHSPNTTGLIPPSKVLSISQHEEYIQSTTSIITSNDIINNMNMNNNGSNDNLINNNLMSSGSLMRANFKGTSPPPLTLSVQGVKLGEIPKERDFLTELSTSHRPLHVLYFQFRDHLTEIAKSALVRAMYHELFLGNANDKASSPRGRKSMRSPRNRSRSPKSQSLSPSRSRSPSPVLNLSRKQEQQLRESEQELPFDSMIGDPLASSTAAPKGAPELDTHAQLFFEECEAVLIALNTKAQNCFASLMSCEQSVKTLDALSSVAASVLHVGGEQRSQQEQLEFGQVAKMDPEAYNRTLEATYKRLGEVAALRLQVSLELGEYRAFFASITSISLSAFDTLIQNSPLYKRCYEIYLNIQSCHNETTNRFNSLRETCRINKLFAKSKGSKQFDAGLYSGRLGSSSNNNSKITTARGRDVNTERVVVSNASNITSANNSPARTPRSTTVVSPLNFVEPRSQQQQRHQSPPNNNSIDTKKEIDKLRTSIEDLEEQLEDAKMSYTKLLKVKDLTPGSLLFYSTICDHQSIVAFKLLYRVLNDLKAFSQGTQHVDFSVLRIKLTECLSACPVLERFICRYTELYKKWLSARMQVFTKRGLVGGGADNQYTCPICHIDSRIQYKPASSQLTAGVSAAVGTDIRGLFPHDKNSAHHHNNDGGGDDSSRNISSAQRLRDGVLNNRSTSRLAPTFKLPAPRPIVSSPKLNDDDMVSLSSYQSAEAKQQHQRLRMEAAASASGQMSSSLLLESGHHQQQAVAKARPKTATGASSGVTWVD